MAWNGGVSLAVWMGGAAVELDCARRAHLGVEDHGVGVDYGCEKQGSHPRTIYNALCLAFDRVLVIDILTGASAGGINGALLGGVITHRRRLHPSFLRDRWLELGDFSKLLLPTQTTEPQSLMDGKLFKRSLVSAFRACLNEGDADPAAAALGDFDVDGWLPEEVMLDVQTTNVYGVQRGFPDHWGLYLYAREYRSPFRFRKRDHFESETLATAARASASFPAAFQPAKIAGDGATIAGFPGKVRWGIDGGLLENAPIEAAIELIPRRPANRKVQRFICYVNADPPGAERTPDEPDEPDLNAVLGYVVSVPRNARFIDELGAVEDATRRASAAADALTELSALPWPYLEQTAKALLPAYRRRRAISSLEEVLVAPGEPPDRGRARAILGRLDDEDQLRLPWIPDGPGLASDLDPWQWGIHAAQRVLFLELDLLRLARDNGAPPDQIYAARAPIDAAINDLDALAARFHATGSIREAARELATAAELEEQLDVLEAAVVPFHDDIVAALTIGSESFLAVLEDLPPGVVPIAAESENDDASRVNRFVRRALAIEVIRRAFVSDRDVESSQAFSFAQLTPLAPCPLLTPTPFGATGPATTQQKLTGISLGHFGAFYRSSWGANDFMWGRLDAAVRIVDLLVSPDRAENVSTRDLSPTDPAQILAEVLVPLEGDATESDKHELVREALLDAAAGYANAPGSVLQLLAAPPPADPELLQEHVHNLIAADLGQDGDAKLTRILCARGAQYEALRQELPVLARQTALDGKLGCFTEPITLDLAVPFVSAIKDLRASADSGLPLPRRLGRGIPDEATSMLALRTLSHAVLVGLGTLKSVSMPLARLTAPVRIPFLSMSGLTSRSIGKRFAAGAAFGAASAYITARLLGARVGETPLESVRTLPVVMMWVAALAAAGLIAVPVWRGIRSDQGLRTVGQWIWAVILVATAGGIIIGFYALPKLGLAETLTASSAPGPPDWLLWIVLAALGPVALVTRRLPILKNIEAPLRGFVDQIDVGGGLTALLVFGASFGIWIWSLIQLVRGLDDGAWHIAGLILVLAATALGIAYARFGRWRGKARAETEA